MVRIESEAADVLDVQTLAGWKWPELRVPGLSIFVGPSLADSIFTK
jgi:hypothetical protein